MVFIACELICMILLIVRRKVQGGELGGKTLFKYLTVGGLVALWLLFIVVSMMVSHDFEFSI